MIIVWVGYTMTPGISIFPRNPRVRFKRFLSVSFSIFDDFNLCQSTLPAIAACVGPSISNLKQFSRGHKTLNPTYYCTGWRDFQHGIKRITIHPYHILDGVRSLRSLIYINDATYNTRYLYTIYTYLYTIYIYTYMYTHLSKYIYIIIYTYPRSIELLFFP